jgi:tetratricopeptide (TPR) repeat protein
MRQKLLGEEHPDVADSLNNLAALYYAMGRYEEAIVYFQSAIALAQKVLGDNHPYTQGFMDNFTQLLREAPEAEVLRVLPEEMHPAIRQLRQ